MTNEEAIARIKNHKIAHKMNEPRAIYISEALDMAIKALEQEPMLDKIKAEIEQVQHDIIVDDKDLDVGKQIAFMFVLQIIDKYKTESEVKE